MRDPVAPPSVIKVRFSGEVIKQLQSLAPKNLNQQDLAARNAYLAQWRILPVKR